MGSGSSKSLHRQDTEDNDDDDPFSEAALAQRTEDVRYRLPINFPIDETIAFTYTAFISPGALQTPTAED